MSINYTWKITSMKVKNVDDLDNVVVQTYWQKKGIDDEGNEGFFNGATPIKVSSNTSNFIEYSDLTQDIVLSWIIPIVDNKHVDEQIKKQIENKRNPIIEMNIPWNTTANNN